MLDAMKTGWPLDPISAVTHPNPYAYYEQLALAERPTWDDGLGLWVVSNPEQVAALLSNPAAEVRVPPGAPAGFDAFARFTNGPRHAELRAEVVDRISGLQVEDPPMSLNDLDSFIENFALYALVRDVRSHVKGDILFQSFDATRALIGNALVALAADPTLTPQAAVDYAVRYDPPVHNTRRTIAADIEFYGAKFRRDDTVLVVLVGATFGSGAHACPGDAIARKIAEMAISRIVLGRALPGPPTKYVDKPNVRIPLFS